MSLAILAGVAAMGCSGSTTTDRTSSADVLAGSSFQIHTYGAEGPTVFLDAPPYNTPLHSAHSYTSSQLANVPKFGVDLAGITAVYSNTTPSFYGQNEVLLFDRDPEEIYASFSSNIDMAAPNFGPGPQTRWDHESNAPIAQVGLAVTLPDAVGMPYPLTPAANPPPSSLSATSLLFLGGDRNAGLSGPAAAPRGNGSVKAAYIVKHGTCSYMKDLQSVLTRVDDTLAYRVGSASGVWGTKLGAKPAVDYVHTMAWMTEGQTPSSPTKGGFILGAWVTDAGNAAVNATFTFGLGSRPPFDGILNVTARENASAHDGLAGGAVLDGLRAALECQDGTSCDHPEKALPATIEAMAFGQQSQALHSAGGYIPCDVSPGIPSDEDIANEPRLPFAIRYCPRVGAPMAVAIGVGADRLRIDKAYRSDISDALVRDDGIYWSNFRCNFHPSYSPTPSCEVVARASRVIAYPDQVELVWFDRPDDGDLTDFSFDGLFADGTLQRTEGFALFVALNASESVDVSPLCGFMPVQSPYVGHAFAHDEWPRPQSGRLVGGTL